MRRTIIALLLATSSLAAHADIPGGHPGWLDLLAHQLGSMHHLPSLLLLVLLGVVVIRGLLGTKTRSR